MKKNKTLSIYLAEFMPLMLFYMFFVHSDEMLNFSNTILGRAFAVALIAFYSSISVLYGIAICVLVIFFYQTDMVQGHSEFIYLSQNPQFYVFDLSNKEGFSTSDAAKEFREEHCDGTQLMYKNYKVRNENAHHVFPEMEFKPNFTCNPCDPSCNISIIESRLTAQEELIYPKMSDDWVNGVWKTWFTDSSTPITNSFSESFGFF
jgi:hypothetical protein